MSNLGEHKYIHLSFILLVREHTQDSQKYITH